jgi:hypothetical protein
VPRRPRVPLRDRTFETEEAAYWYFRLNGCFTIENFVVHPEYVDTDLSQRTDADILAVRLPVRREDPYAEPMSDAEKLVSDKPLLVIAEVKLSKVDLNGPWTKPERNNIHRVLRAAGLLDSDDEIDLAAHSLYTNRRYVGSDAEVRMFALGDAGADELQRHRSGVITVLWSEALGFIHDRFTRYRRIKADHDQWRDAGRDLYDLAVDMSEVEFVEHVRGRLRDQQGNALAP